MKEEGQGVYGIVGHKLKRVLHTATRYLNINNRVPGKPRIPYLHKYIIFDTGRYRVYTIYVSADNYTMYMQNMCGCLKGWELLNKSSQLGLVYCSKSVY